MTLKEWLALRKMSVSALSKELKQKLNVVVTPTALGRYIRFERSAPDDVRIAIEELTLREVTAHSKDWIEPSEEDEQETTESAQRPFGQGEVSGAEGVAA